MIKLMLSLAAATMILTACNGKKTEEHGHDHGTHEHADGQVHEAHQEEAVQEEFTVSKDTTAASENLDHQHKPGDDHQH